VTTARTRSPAARPSPVESRRSPDFARRLALITVVALVVRIAWVFAVAGHYRLGNDASWYRFSALDLAMGRGYVSGLVLIRPQPATAQFPPGFETYLAAAAWIFGHSRLVAQLAQCAAGTATVAVTGLVARRVAGDGVALLAAALAAVWPNLVVADGTLMSETLFTLLVLLVVLAAYRVLERPSVVRWCVLGALAGLAMLTRGEATLLLPFLVVPVAFRARGSWTHNLALAAVATLVALAVLVPWTVRNERTFHRFFWISTNTGNLIRDANCAPSYHGRFLGQWVFYCGVVPPGDNEAANADAARRAGIDYARNHPKRVPIVVAARLGRTFGVFRPLQEVRLGTAEGRPYGLALTGLLAYYLLVVAAIGGAVVLVRARATVLPLASVLALVVVTTALTYGNLRFRSALEPVLLVLGATGIAAAWRALVGRHAVRPAG
jgi:4-amino-4-deoxy-L-arabinose transferase-like glycosyltransferase